MGEIMSAVPLTDLVGPAAGGRVFAECVRPGLADCAPTGRIRLDALARWVQDVAYADVLDAGLADSAVWVIRRARMHVRRFPRFGERVELVTFCSGLGRMWAERRTTITSGQDDGGHVEAVALWVHLDQNGEHPTPLSEAELRAYASGAAAERRVSARLRHPAPPDGCTGTAWRLRAAELDLAGHINNSAFWQPLEEELLASPDPDGLDVEIEHRAPAQPGEVRFLRDGPWRWLVGADGARLASFRLA